MSSSDSGFTTLQPLAVNCSDPAFNCTSTCSNCTYCNCTCFDGEQNQLETGVDCGGPCAACPNCTDRIKNQNETGIDCGGVCPACPNCNITCGGLNCPVCNCTDGKQNQGEEGIDCGGPCLACHSCEDNIKNGDETSIDCGGVKCPSCNLCGLLGPGYSIFGSPADYRFQQGDWLSNTGQAGPICIIITTGLNVTRKAVFYPYVDQYAELTISKSFNSSLTLSNSSALDLTHGTTVRVQVGNVLSARKFYTWANRGVQYVAPLFTIIINVDGGTVTEVNWDEGCDACRDVACNSRICGNDIAQCDIYGGPVNCDVRIFASWFGSDSGARYLTSTGAILSRFRSYSIKSAYDNAAQSTSSSYPQLGEYNP